MTSWDVAGCASTGFHGAGESPSLIQNPQPHQALYPVILKHGHIQREGWAARDGGNEGREEGGGRMCDIAYMDAVHSTEAI